MMRKTFFLLTVYFTVSLLHVTVVITIILYTNNYYMLVTIMHNYMQSTPNQTSS